MNFVKFLRTPFFKEHLWWLLLEILVSDNICNVLVLVAFSKQRKQQERVLFPSFLRQKEGVYHQSTVKCSSANVHQNSQFKYGLIRK